MGLSLIATLFLLLVAVLPAAANEDKLSWDVVINEIHHNPELAYEAVEFVELFNRGRVAVDLSRWLLDDGIQFVFPDGATIAAGGYLVIAQDPNAFRAKYGFTPLGPFVGKLANEGELIVLRNRAAVAVDRVEYGLGFPWPVVGPSPGASMQLVNPGLDNMLAGNWRAALPSPGQRNPVWTINPPPLIYSVTHSPVRPTANQPVTITAEVTDADGPPKDVVLTRQKDGSYLVSGKNPPTATYTLIGELPAGTYTGLRLDVFADKSLPANGPGRVKHGNFVLNHLRLSLAGKQIPFGGARASHAQDGYPAKNALDGNIKASKDGTGWAIGPQYGKDNHAEFGFAAPVTLEKPTKFSIQLIQTYGTSHTIGRFRVRALTQATDLIVPDEIRTLLTKATAKRTPDEKAQLESYFTTQVAPETRTVAAAIAKLKSAAPAKPELNVRVVSQRSKDPRQSHILNRGEFKQPLDPVDPGTPAVLPPVKHREKSGDRLDLARWLVSGENPLPPRVAVNHVWAYLFGAGIVPTMNDFGVRGDRPSHPQLLDWLASEFIRVDWSRKDLIRTIVNSSTYRQSSNHRPELREVDPKNRLLARQNRFRVEAEIVRDLSLAAAGLLSDKIGGPSVFPPMPEGVANVNYNSAFKWKVSADEDRYRRGLYTFFKRTAPHPTLMTFDCPDSNVTNVQRTRSNTPLAALVTLNNEVYREAAIALSRRVIEENANASDGEKIARAFSFTVTRSPDSEERKALLDLLAQSRAYYKNNPEAATQLLGELPAAADTKIPPAELASWTATLRVLLNLDEFLTRS